MKSQIFEKQPRREGCWLWDRPLIARIFQGLSLPPPGWAGACPRQSPPRRPPLGRDSGWGEQGNTKQLASLCSGAALPGSGAATTRRPLQGRLWFPWQPHHCHRADWPSGGLAPVAERGASQALPSAHKRAPPRWLPPFHCPLPKAGQE